MSSTSSPRARRTVIIGVLGAALAAGGGAAVWAASTPSSSTTSPSTPSPSPTSPSAHQSSASPGAKGHGFALGAGRGGLHGEVTAKRSDGTYVTLVSQRGTVTEVSGTKLTVKSEDGYTHSYVFNGGTKLRSASDKQGAALTAGDLKVGDEVAVRAERTGGDDTAKTVIRGPFPATARAKAQGQS